MTGFIRAYLRASTEDQDATRAREQLQEFASEKGLKVASWYVENVSGATLKRPELMRLLNDAQPGDVLLLEQVDRLARLTQGDWGILKGLIQSKGLKVVALDLPTSLELLTPPKEKGDLTSWMLSAINAMLLDILAAVARKDYEDRRRRQEQGIKKAQEAGKYKGRLPDLKLHERIKTLRDAGQSWSDIQEVLGVSRATISKVLKA